jgi:hypothetical protein
VGAGIHRIVIEPVEDRSHQRDDPRPSPWQASGMDVLTASRRPALILLVSLLLAACGGGGDDTGPAPATPSSGVSSVMAPEPPPASTPPATPIAGAPRSVVLPPPVLSFNDTGISVTDGLTTNGKWSVSSPLDGLGWEYSLDMGRTWIRGEGDSFEVTGDGPKTIWARTFDVNGNTSEIVMTSCTLDTLAPTAPRVSPIAGATLQTIRIEGLEAMARWEYSVDAGQTWLPGRGDGLGFAGNAIRQVWSRQVDAAGNPSPAVVTVLDAPEAPSWIEASDAPLDPTALPRWEGTLLLHGEVWRADTDFVRFEVPAGLQLRALRLVDYRSPDEIAFYALQRGPVFDAGTDVQRMVAWKHLGPPDRQVNLLETTEAAARGPGLFVLWINQTGNDRTAYAVEIELGPP